MELELDITYEGPCIYCGEAILYNIMHSTSAPMPFFAHAAIDCPKCKRKAEDIKSAGYGPDLDDIVRILKLKQIYLPTALVEKIGFQLLVTCNQCGRVGMFPIGGFQQPGMIVEHHGWLSTVTINTDPQRDYILCPECKKAQRDKTNG